MPRLISETKTKVIRPKVPIRVGQGECCKNTTGREQCPFLAFAASRDGSLLGFQVHMPICMLYRQPGAEMAPTPLQESVLGVVRLAACIEDEIEEKNPTKEAEEEAQTRPPIEHIDPKEYEKAELFFWFDK